MAVYIDNTNVLRVTNAKLTTVDGSTTPLEAAGTVTIYDSEGNEVAGQNWPTALTLNSPGNYAALIESDVEFLPYKVYTAKVVIGTEPNALATFNCSIRPENRYCS